MKKNPGNTEYFRGCLFSSSLCVIISLRTVVHDELPLSRIEIL